MARSCVVVSGVPKAIGTGVESDGRRLLLHNLIRYRLQNLVHYRLNYRAHYPAPLPCSLPASQPERRLK